MINSFTKIVFILSVLEIGHLSTQASTSFPDIENNVPQDTIKIKGCDYKKLYYDDGKLKEEGCLINGIKEGLWKEVSQNKFYVYEVNYEKGVKKGNYKIYYDTGELRGFGKYLNDTPVDTFMTYKKNGELICKGFLEQIGYKKSNVTWRKYYDKDAKKDGTFEQKDGKTYMWQLGEMIEFKLNKNKYQDKTN